MGGVVVESVLHFVHVVEVLVHYRQLEEHGMQFVVLGCR